MKEMFTGGERIWNSNESHISFLWFYGAGIYLLLSGKNINSERTSFISFGKPLPLELYNLRWRLINAALDQL